ncbi:MAG TPA: HisA/HisF-related TIM barrel protein [Acidimicrobiales bacterium]|nr:HisA/HisF-related TIM barrel protein [Acidimicrobiales bacterium]
MDCLPAIDIRGGRCVRLLRGSFDQETVYGDPVAQAIAYRDAGARALHVVDLDAARTGAPVNRDTVRRIVDATALPVQYGGGVRDEAAVESALGAGIDRVVLGTFAVEEPGRALALARRFPGRVVVGLDHRRVEGPAGTRREVAVRGWEQGAGVDLLDALERFAGSAVAAAVVTDITRDGTLAGPDLDGYSELLAALDIPLVASGGIGGVADIVALARLEHGGRRLAAAVVGRALLDGSLSIGEAVAACTR